MAIPKIIAVSGGRTSGMMTYLELQRYNAVGHPDRLPQNVHFLFCNTSAEHPSTYKFLGDMIKYWNLPLVCLEWTPEKLGNTRYTKKYKQVAYENMKTDKSLLTHAINHVGNGKLLPHKHGRFCSDVLKQTPIKQFMQDKNYTDFINVVGIRADEPKRINTARTKWRKNCYYTKEYPLYNAGITKADIFKFWDKMPFNLDLPIIHGKNPFGNCVGCFMKSEAELIMILQNDISALDHLIEMEQKTQTTFRQRDGKKLWLRELKELVEKSPPKNVQLGLKFEVYCPVGLGTCTD